MLSEISQMQKNKFHMFYLYVEVKKKKSTWNYNTDFYRLRRVEVVEKKVDKERLAQGCQSTD
jgi:hypothetical protein